MIEQMNLAARRILHANESRAEALGIKFHDRRTVDFGVDVRGGLEAGLLLSRICMGGLGDVKLVVDGYEQPPIVQVVTDQPALACMGSQYGGWQVAKDDFFAIGSGPIRLLRGKEKVLEHYGWSHSDSKYGVLVLESSQMPTEDVTESILAQTGLAKDRLLICVAPTRSMAGSLQIVARSVESTMHKLFELGVDLNKVSSARGLSPLPPVSVDDLTGIGRTNDSIMYCGRVNLWVEMDDEQINELGPKVPSNSSSEFGKSFEELFRACGGDFYKMDPMLFSAARVQFISNLTGNSFWFGESLDQMVFDGWF